MASSSEPAELVVRLAVGVRNATSAANGCDFIWTVFYEVVR